MAKKKRSGAKGRRDILPNRKKIIVSFAAATTTAVYTQFDTGMSMAGGLGWNISRIDIGPRTILDGWATTTCGVFFQIAAGEQTAILNDDDVNVVATMSVQLCLLTSGFAMLLTPMTWVGPLLVAAPRMTCVMDASDDVAPLQSPAQIVFTIWYNWVALGAQEYVEIAQARGVA